MLEILLPAIVLFLSGTTAIGAVKRRRSRKRGIIAIPFQGTIVLSTLADDTVICNNLYQPDDDFYCVSMDIAVAMRAHTAGEGPIYIGANHGDYSVTEIKECLQAQTNYTSPNLLVENEQRKRKVRRIGVFHGLGTEEVLFDGNEKRIPLRFKIGASKNLQLYAHNQSGAALTTGTVVEASGVLYGRWA